MSVFCDRLFSPGRINGSVFQSCGSEHLLNRGQISGIFAAGAGGDIFSLIPTGTRIISGGDRGDMLTVAMPTPRPGALIKSRGAEHTPKAFAIIKERRQADRDT